MKRTNFKSICIKSCSILAFSLFLFCFACNQQSDESVASKDIQNVDPVEGVWELTSFYWVHSEWGDTLYPDPDQIGVKHKIYLDGYVMWTADPKSDSSEWHGYGTYHFSNDTLVEKLSTMSLPMKAEMGSNDEVIFRTEYNSNTFKQTSEKMHRNLVYQFIEEWKKLN